jgi:hypothetical protein
MAIMANVKEVMKIIMWRNENINVIISIIIIINQ